LSDNSDSDDDNDLLGVNNLQQPADPAAAAADASPNAAAAADADAAADNAAEAAAPAAAAAAASLREAQQLGRLYRCGDKSQLPLRMTLRLLAAGQPQVAELYKDWMVSMDAWDRVTERSVKGLLNVLCTGENERSGAAA
jgi:hypothetical protein